MTVKNHDAQSFDPVLEVTGFSLSHCLSYCQSGHPVNCRAVVFHSSGLCKFYNVSRFSNADFVLTESSLFDYFEFSDYGK